MSIFSTEPIVPMRQRVREGKTNAANVCVLLFFFYNPKQEHEQGDASHKKQSLCVSFYFLSFQLRPVQNMCPSLFIILQLMQKVSVQVKNIILQLACSYHLFNKKKLTAASRVPSAPAQGRYKSQSATFPFPFSHLYLIKLGYFSRGGGSREFCFPFCNCCRTWYSGAVSLVEYKHCFQSTVCYSDTYRDLLRLCWQAATSSLGCHSSRQQVWIENIRNIDYRNEIMVWLMDWQEIHFLLNLAREPCFRNCTLL